MNTLTLRLAMLASPTTLGVTAAAVALSEVRQDLALGATDASVLVVFTVGVAVGTPIAGRLEQVYGVRQATLIASAVLAAGALLTVFGPELGTVLLGRLLIGVGSGGLTTTAFVGAGRAERPALAFAAVAAAMNGLAGAGALVGALVASELGWRVALVLPALALIVVPFELRRPQRLGAAEGGDGLRLDAVGMALTVVTVCAAVLAVAGADAGIGLFGSLAAMLAAVVAGTATAAWGRRAGPHGFVPVRALADRWYRRALLVGALFMGANFSTLFLVPILLDRAGLEPVVVGLVVLPASAVAVVAGLGAARLHRRGRGPLVMGVAGVVVQLVLTVAAALSAPSSYAVAVAAVLGATALSQAVLTTIVASALRDIDRPGALGLFNLTLQTGGAAGVALTALVVSASTTAALASAGGLGLAGAAAAATLRRRPFTEATPSTACSSTTGRPAPICAIR